MKNFLQRNFPEPWILALFLTGLAMLASVFWQGFPLSKTLIAWKAGFFGLLAFSMQMSLMLVFGHALACAKIFQTSVRRLANLPSTPGAAIILVAVCGILSGWVNWGLSIVLSAMLAREVGISCKVRNIPVHYPLLGVGAYLGLAVWHGGLSGSAPLTVATHGHSLEGLVGVLPVELTLFAWPNLTLNLVLLVLLPLLLLFMQPAIPKPCPLNHEVPDSEHTVTGTSLADALENSRSVNIATGAIGVLALLFSSWESGFSLNLDNILFILMICGVLVHESPKAYLSAVSAGAANCAGILLQFPFYGGILGIVSASGMVTDLASWLAAIGSPRFYLLLVFLSAGLINFFIPSGGGQWALQGPVAVQGAISLGISPEHAVMALAWGDQWTNLCQPFWALALLGITGLKAHELMGYCLVLMAAGLLVFPIVLLQM